MSRPLPDETLSAILWEHKDRGRKGYDLTEQFFDLFHLRFTDLRLDVPKWKLVEYIRLGSLSRLPL